MAERHLGLALAAVLAAGLAGCASTPGSGTTNGAPDAAIPAPSTPDHAAGDELARGREQLIRAFDAAWVRVLASGRQREILQSMPPQKPGAAQDYMWTLADCLPLPERTPFPEQPVGLLKQVLDRGVIRRVIQDVPATPGDTATWFSPISDAYLRAVMDEIGTHYGVQLRLEDAPLPPGPAPTTSMLLDDKGDFVDQMNATGGETQDLRRRISRRFTCTMSASSQYIHIPEGSPLVTSLRHFDDLLTRPEVRICAGPLTTQTARAFMPRHKVATKYVGDLSGCAKDVAAGRADVIMNPLPDLSIAGVTGYRAVPTQLVAGTPLWVALEGIQCPSDGNPRTEDPCFEVSPP